jgi:translation initiation factor 3 subunit K
MPELLIQLLFDPITASCQLITPVLRETYVPQHAHLVDTFRVLFATSIASCFSRVRLAQLARWLDLPENEVSQWCAGVQWSVEGDVAVVPKNGDNDVKAGVVKEHVELSRELHPILRAEEIWLVC